MKNLGGLGGRWCFLIGAIMFKYHHYHHYRHYRWSASSVTILIAERARRPMQHAGAMSHYLSFNNHVNEMPRLCFAFSTSRRRHS